MSWLQCLRRAATLCTAGAGVPLAKLLFVTARDSASRQKRLLRRLTSSTVSQRVDGIRGRRIQYSVLAFSHECSANQASAVAAAREPLMLLRAAMDSPLALRWAGKR